MLVVVRVTISRSEFVVIQIKRVSGVGCVVHVVDEINGKYSEK